MIIEIILKTGIVIASTIVIYYVISWLYVEVKNTLISKKIHSDIGFQRKLTELINLLPEATAHRLIIECVLELSNLLKEPEDANVLKVLQDYKDGKINRFLLPIIDFPLKDFDYSIEIPDEIYYAKIAVKYCYFTIAGVHVISPETVTVCMLATGKSPKHYYDKLLNSLTELERALYEI